VAHEARAEYRYATSFGKSPAIALV
jgi:hypothetical protein